MGMISDEPVLIRRISTGVPGLDEVLGDGGLPEYSFNLIAGGPGAGKTTLAQQFMFANATEERPAVHFTVLGEPPLKMLRYQQQFSFFDRERVHRAIHYFNLSDEVLRHDLGKVLERIVREVEKREPAVVVVDSFRTVVRASTLSEIGEMELQSFVQRLALQLTTWQATTFLVGEYLESEMKDNPIFTVADGIIWLLQDVQRNSIVRKLQVMKMRGQASMPGLHTFRISDRGLQVYPRLLAAPREGDRTNREERLATGIEELDEMMGGGIPAGDSVLLAGPAGCGKTTFGTQFIAEGARRNQPGVIAVFEEHPTEYIRRARALGLDLASMVDEGMLKVMYLRPLDLSVDETLQELRDSVRELNAKRVMIDSLSGFEIALAPTFREDFRESLYRMLGALTGIGVTVLMTVEVSEAFTELNFSPHSISFLTDDILLQRYVEIEGQLQRFLTVIKMRGSQHSKAMRAYELTSRGLVLGGTMEEYRGLFTGAPVLREPTGRMLYPGLTADEVHVLQALAVPGETTIDALIKETGRDRSELVSILNRLEALNYVIQDESKGKTVYRPVA